MMEQFVYTTSSRSTQAYLRWNGQIYSRICTTCQCLRLLLPIFFLLRLGHDPTSRRRTLGRMPGRACGHAGSGGDDRLATARRVRPGHSWLGPHGLGGGGGRTAMAHEELAAAGHGEARLTRPRSSGVGTKGEELYAADGSSRKKTQ